MDKKNTLGQTAHDIASFWNHDGVKIALQPDYNENIPREPVHFFTVRNLDRASEKRKNSQWLKSTLVDSTNAHIIAFVRNFPILQVASRQYSIRLFKPAELKGYVDLYNYEQSEIVFLGFSLSDVESSGSALFAVNLSNGM